MNIAENDVLLPGTLSSFERALHNACDRTFYDESDAQAVRSALGAIPVGHIPPRHVSKVAEAWLQAAVILEREDLPRNFTTMVGLVAAGTGFAAFHAQQLIELFAGEPANDTSWTALPA